MTEPRPTPIETLLAEQPWVERLAAGLVRDSSLAEDLAQEAWLLAARRGPRAPGTLRGFLAGVLANLRRNQRRGEERRARREAFAAAPEALPSAAELVERAELQRLLVESVLALAETECTAILLRYFEGLSSEEIARRSGVPSATVRARIQRWLEKLRQRLEARIPRRDLFAGLVGLARSPLASAPAPAAGAGGTTLPWFGGLLVMKTLPTLGAVCAVLAALVAGLWFLGRDEGAARERGTSSAVSPTLADIQAPAGSSPAMEALQAARESLPVTPHLPDPVAAPTPGRMRGRVLDPDGTGLEGVRVGFDVESDPQPVVSGLHGEFELAALDRTVVSLDERFATVMSSRLDPRRSLPGDVLTVVVAPAVRLGGVVLDDQGAPVAAATVQPEIPLSFRGRFREALDSSREHWWYDRGHSSWTNKTDEQGRFLLGRVPGLTCAKLVARASHGRSARVPVPDHDDLGLELVLTVTHSHDYVPGPDSLHLLGEVRHADGRLAPGALVSLDGYSTRADEQALFELFAPPASAESSRQLFAVVEGEQAASFAPAYDAGGEELWPSFVVLRLGGAPESIAGRVLGADGQAIAKAEVWIEGLTFAGKTEEHGFRTLEGQMAGGLDQGDGANRPWSRATTDGDGWFAITGLRERDYTVAAMDPVTLQVVRVGPVAAGTRDVEIRLAPDGLWERVAGRVVDTHGNPLAGLRVTPRQSTSFVRWERSSWREVSQGAEVRTDDSGGFELREVSRIGVILRITGDRFIPVEVALDDVADPLAIRVEVPWLGHLQIELAGSAPEGASIELLGPDGAPVEFHIFGGGSSWTRQAIDLGNEDEFVGGRTPVLSVPETARAAILRDAQGNELLRVPLTLGDDLTTVRL